MAIYELGECDEINGNIHIVTSILVAIKIPGRTLEVFDLRSIPVVLVQLHVQCVRAVTETRKQWNSVMHGGPFFVDIKTTRGCKEYGRQWSRKRY